MKKLLLANLVVLPLISTPAQSDILDDLSGRVAIDSHGHVDIYLEFDDRNHRKHHRGHRKRGHHRDHRAHHRDHRGHHRDHRAHHRDPHRHHGPVVHHRSDYYNHDCRERRCTSGRWDDDRRRNWDEDRHRNPRYDRYYRK